MTEYSVEEEILDHGDEELVDEGEVVEEVELPEFNYEGVEE